MSKEIAQTIAGPKVAWLLAIVAAFAVLATIASSCKSEPGPRALVTSDQQFVPISERGDYRDGLSCIDLNAGVLVISFRSVGGDSSQAMVFIADLTCDDIPTVEAQHD